MTRRPVRVLYFAGSGRSGTTIINTMLGQMPGVFAAGELRYLWERGVAEDHRCGCGQPFSTCSTWQAVMELIGHPDAASSQAVADRLRSRLRIMRMPLVIARRLARQTPVPPHPDDDRIAALYEAIADHTGAHIIVDSSKLPPYGLLLGSRPEIDLRVLHVVRDPRATAFSWLRKKVTQDLDTETHMPRIDVGKSSLLWLLWNLLADHWWPSSRSDVVRFRYEEFARNPRAEMARVANLCGLDPADLPFVGDHEVTLAPTHSVAGNPNRHTTGTVTIKADNEWRERMPRRQRALVTLLTSPGLLRFGYAVRDGLAAARPQARHAITRLTTSSTPKERAC